jgi:hypothetical protein
MSRRRNHIVMLRAGDYDNFVDAAHLHEAEISPLAENERTRKSVNGK